ncbi:uncharacterized protein DMAD_03892 [Drosophila madeirensis]|uniref:C-type lectin domain-containing protein n=1 Tax=Drosophila madeirensis TaxID=30013 RepID=A0AAU9GBQ3_DROMD
MDLQVTRIMFFLWIFVIFWKGGDVNCTGCHYFSSNKLDWFGALFFCQNMKMCLADMSTRKSFEELESKVQDRSEYWIGLNGYEKLEFKYVSTNSPKNYMPPQSELEFYTSCGFLHPMGSDSYTIKTANCGHHKRFVCTPSYICNGLKTNSTSVNHFAKELPLTCHISDNAHCILDV